MNLTTGNIAEITGAVLSGSDKLVVSDIIIDSRRASYSEEGTAFFALKGNNTNGHDFIGNCYRYGIRIFVVDNNYSEKPAELFKEAVFIRVRDTLESLHLVAAYRRDSFRGNVIAITGSNGKTIVKEWLADILGKTAPVIRSPRSYNSQTGVPLSLWGLDDSFQFGIFEAGMSMPGEIKKLEKIIKPDLGIFTNIGEAHQENFPNIESKIKEKLDLFVNSKTIIYSSDHEEVDRIIREDSKYSGKHLFRWSEKDNSASLFVSRISSDGSATTLKFSSGKTSFEAEIPFIDRISCENVISVVAALLVVGISPEIIIPNLKELFPVAMRLEQKEGINGCILIEDYYNSDPVSLSLALEHLANQPLEKKTLVISDFVQSNRDSKSLFSEVVMLSKKAGVNRYIGVGPKISLFSDLFPEGSVFFSSTNDMRNWFAESAFENEAILIKGARLFQLEDIGQMLEKTVHQTQLEINLNAILHNLNIFKSKISKGTRIMAMVKAFAYGAGPKDIAEWLNYNGIDYLGVAYTEEGLNLRKSGVTNRIMVMSPEPYTFRLMINNDLEPELYSLDILKQFISEAERNGLVNYPVHLKLDTGMHRLGISEDDVEHAVSILVASNAVKLISVFTHLAATEDPTMDKTTEKQVGSFNSMCNLIHEGYGKGFLKHLLNSAGIMRFPKYAYDMVRLGIGLYGLPGSLDPGLKPAATFKTRILQVKKIDPGEGVGYGLTGVSDHPRDIATLPVGYADGLNRHLGQGSGRMFFKGRYIHTVGTICMDMCMVDVTGLEATPGDQVEIFGENIRVEEIAEICDTIPYEILTAIPSRVKRIYFYE